MQRWEREIAINSPASKVYEYLLDFTRHPEWAGRPLDIRKTSDGPVGVGTRFTSVGKQFGTHTDEVTITELVPSARIVFESHGDAGVLRHWFTMREEGGGTRLAKGSEALKLSMPSILLSPMLAFAVPKAYAGDLQKIKAKVEGIA